METTTFKSVYTVSLVEMLYMYIYTNMVRIAAFCIKLFAEVGGKGDQSVKVILILHAVDNNA